MNRRSMCRSSWSRRLERDGKVHQALDRVETKRDVQHSHISHLAALDVDGNHTLGMSAVKHGLWLCSMTR